MLDSVTGQILIADDEPIVRESMAEFLRLRGHQCECVADADEAEQRLRASPYDLLIADIRMPGNPDLALVRRVAKLAPGLPVILVTGYPTLGSAIDSVNLQVSAYLVKPVDFAELESEVRRAVRYARTRRAVRALQSRLREWQAGVDAVNSVLATGPRACEDGPADTFMTMSLGHARDALRDMQALSDIAPSGNPGSSDPVCLHSGCPRLHEVVAVLMDTVAVLERTKKAFRSKELGDLRVRLEAVVKDMLTC